MIHFWTSFEHAAADSQPPVAPKPSGGGSTLNPPPAPPAPPCFPQATGESDRPGDVLKTNINDEGGDDSADALRYMVATKPLCVRQVKLRGL